MISSVTQAFCRDCNRARLSTEGKLFLCLFASRGHDLRALLREAAPSRRRRSRPPIGEIWHGRDDRYSELRGARQADPGSGAAARRDALHRRMNRMAFAVDASDVTGLILAGGRGQPAWAVSTRACSTSTACRWRCTP